MVLRNLAPEFIEAICDDVRAYILYCAAKSGQYSAYNARCSQFALGMQTACRVISLHFEQSNYEWQIDRIEALVEGRWPHPSQGVRTLY